MKTEPKTFTFYQTITLDRATILCRSKRGAPQEVDCHLG